MNEITTTDSIYMRTASIITSWALAAGVPVLLMVTLLLQTVKLLMVYPSAQVRLFEPEEQAILY